MQQKLILENWRKFINEVEVSPTSTNNSNTNVVPQAQTSNVSTLNTYSDKKSKEKYTVGPTQETIKNFMDKKDELIRFVNSNSKDINGLKKIYDYIQSLVKGDDAAEIEKAKQLVLKLANSTSNLQNEQIDLTKKPIDLVKKGYTATQIAVAKEGGAEQFYSKLVKAAGVGTFALIIGSILADIQSAYEAGGAGGAVVMAGAQTAAKLPELIKSLKTTTGGDITHLFDIDTKKITDSFVTEAKKKKGGDRCTRIAKRKYDVWPSAYASGAVVKCRQGKIWKGISENATDEEIDLILEKWSDKYKRSIDCKNPKGFSQKAHCQGKKKNEDIDLGEVEVIEEAKKKAYKPNFSKEKEQGLHGWFARNDGKGWVNCRTGGPCGRESADSGGKYPACRPTKAQCKSAGKGPLRKKKSSSPISWTKKKKKD